MFYSLMNDYAEDLDNEWFMVRHSGEMPEVALHSSLHYLTESEDGPRLVLQDRHLRRLRQAAEARYKEIVLRDLQHENRGTTISRGVQRSIVNYRRYQQFCLRQGLDGSGFAREVAASLLLLLGSEAAEAAKGRGCLSLNCTFEELDRFAVEIGLVGKGLPATIACLCAGEGG